MTIQRHDTKLKTLCLNWKRTHQKNSNLSLLYTQTMCNVQIELDSIVKLSLTCFFIRRNSLDLNSFLADFWRRSIKSSPLRSITSSFSSSVVFALISFSSASLFDIITTEGFPYEEIAAAGTRAEALCEILTPWNEEEVEVFPRRKVTAVPGEAIERLSIVAMGERRRWEFTREFWG